MQAGPTPGRSSAPPVTGAVTGAAGLPLIDFSAWSWWWEFNKEPFLDVKGHLFRTAPDTEGGGFFLGRGDRQPLDASTFRPSPQLIGEVAIPALLRVLDNYEADSLASSALIALARIGARQETSRERIAAAITPFMKSSSQELAETAVCAIGILGDERSSLALGEILLDTEAGRKLVASTNSISTRTRAFAAFGLGLLGHHTANEDVRRLVVHRLAAAYREDDTGAPDVRVACILAMGVSPLQLGPASADEDAATLSYRQEQLRFLARILADRRAGRFERAHAASALARLTPHGADDVSQVLLHRAIEACTKHVDKRVPREVAQACVQALGQMVDTDSDPVDRNARRVLTSIERVVGDQLARNMALVSLAQIALRAEDTGDTLEVQNELRSHLLSHASRLQTARGRWAALALGVLGHGRIQKGKLPHPDLVSAMQAGLRETRAPIDVGVYATVCGMLRDPRSESALLEKLEKTADDRTRGFLALGLGMLGAHSALPKLREIVRASTYRPDLLQEASLAIALLADRDATQELVERLRATRSLASQASLARAVGRIGDASTVQPLVDMLADDGVTPVARSFAAAALGRVGDTAPLPWNTIYSLDVAYGASTATLFDSVGFGILNLL